MKNARNPRKFLAFALVALLALMFLSQSSRMRKQLPPSSPVTINHARDISLTAVPTSPDSIGRTGADPAAFAAFDAWARGVLAQPNQPLKPEELERGVALAKVRQTALAALIESDPQQALQRAVPYAVRAAMPAEIQANFEKQVDGHGAFSVAIGTSLSSNVSKVYRTATINGNRYTAYVYGRRETLPSKSDIPLHGIAIGNTLALHESPVRVLAQGELPDPALPIFNKDERCPISGLASREVTVDAGGIIIYLCCSGHIGPIEKKLVEGETLNTAWGVLSSTSDQTALSGPLQSAYTQGVKNLLLMRVDFSDAPVASGDTTFNSSLVDGLNTFYTQCSYGTAGFNAVGSGSAVTPIMRMPQTFAYYSGNNFYDQLRADAKTAAASAGFTVSTYQFDVTCMSSGSGGSFGGWAGLGYVGAPGAWVRTSSTGVAAHELGHNFGLWHANYWSAASGTTVGPGSNSEYGNQYDTMGSANGGSWQFNAYEKNLLQWLPNANVTTVTANGTYRIYAFDAYTLDSANMYALKFPRDTQRTYWVDYRQLFSSNNWESNGAEVLWGAWSQSNGGSQILDTTPASPNGLNDAAVVIGRTFDDPTENIYITTVSKNTTSPPSLDIVVNTGPFPGNSPPLVALGASQTSTTSNTGVTLTATASDPDNDPMAYYWEFGDGTYSVDNSATQTKSWSSTGEYRVRCTVSDMKGGETIKSIIITVGTPTTFRLSGTVTAGGRPLANVRVTDSSSVAYTDSDGSYTLVGESGGNKTLSASIYDCSVTATFTNPVSVSGSLSGLDFTGVFNTHAITGTVTDFGVAVAGVTISNGTTTTTTDATGKYTFSGLVNASYAITASKHGYQFSPVQRVEVLGADATLNFTRQLYTVAGLVSGINASATVDIGDGLHTATAINQGGGNYRYTISVPGGNWNLKATLAGFTIRPGNFTDPLTVSANLTNKNFTAVSGTSYSISGQVTGFAGGVPGVVVSNGSASSTSDSNGNYVIIGVANGSYTLTPSISGAIFTPASASATVASANVTGKNFAAAFPIAITTAASLPGGIVGAPYSNPFALSGGIAPFTWSVSSGTLPDGLTLSTDGILSGIPTTTGSSSFTVDVTDAASLTASASFTLVVALPNQAPLVTSGIGASPAQPVVGDSVTFIFGVNDPDGNALTFAWDFGDGSTDTTSSPTHSYATAGDYTVQVTATDPGGLSATSSMILTVANPGTVGLPSGTISMTVTKVSGSAKFTGGGHDTVSISGSIPNVPKGFTATGKSLTVNYSGATATFTLDANGHAHIATGAVALKLKPSIRLKTTKQVQFQGGSVAFQIKLSNGTWAGTWGLDSTATTTAIKSMGVTVLLDGTLYGATSNVTYSSKAKVGAKFKK